MICIQTGLDTSQIRIDVRLRCVWKRFVTGTPPSPRYRPYDYVYNVQVDAAVLGDRLPEPPSRRAPKKMLSQYPLSAFPGLCGGTRGGQQQFVTQTLRVHLLGLDYCSPSF